MMARRTNAPCKGRIQKRKTTLHLFKSDLQRTAGPYKGATTRLMHRTNDECSKKELAVSRVQTKTNFFAWKITPICCPIVFTKLSNLDLSAKFHHLSRGHAEEGCGAFGVVLQKCEESLAPYCHAHDLVTRDDRLAADIICDICGVDAA